MTEGNATAVVSGARRRDLQLDTECLESGYVRVFKPIFDRVAGAILLVLFAPLMLLVATGVLLTLGRPILYKQKRVGLGGREFTMLKFRSMLPDRRVAQVPFRGHDRRRTHKTPEDPRHTPFGFFIRKFSLDELPQLWNVVRGDLSLVGPRPELCSVVAEYEPWQHHRHAVKPGLTGLWQVTQRDDRGEMKYFVHVDLQYIASLTALTDFQILLLTLPTMLRIGNQERGALPLARWQEGRSVRRAEVIDLREHVGMPDNDARIYLPEVAEADA